MRTDLILAVAALAVLLGAEAVYQLVSYTGQRRRLELRRRLQATVGGTASGSLLREQRYARSPHVAKLAAALPGARWLHKILLRTDLELTVAALYGLSLALAVGTTVLLALVARGSLLLALLGGPIGLTLPLLVVLRAQSRRNRKISEQLPDALDMMVRALRAGHGLGSGFKLVATEMSEPIAVEFARCFEEQNAGASLPDALRNMTERVPNNLDLKILAVSVAIQHETGGNLVESLEKIAGTIRARYQFFGKLRALTAEARFSGHLLGALPLICLFVISLLNPGYLDPLVTDPIGRTMALAGVLLWGIGLLWMHRLAQVDY